MVWVDLAMECFMQVAFGVVVEDKFNAALVEVLDIGNKIH